MNYIKQVKSSRYWITFISTGFNNTPMMIKFTVHKCGVDDKNNTAENAIKIWDEMYAWTYGSRVEGMPVMINISDINRAIHSKINFVSLISKPQKQE